MNEGRRLGVANWSTQPSFEWLPFTDLLRKGGNLHFYLNSLSFRHWPLLENYSVGQHYVGHTKCVYGLP